MEGSPIWVLLTNIVGDLVKLTTLGDDWCKLLEKTLKTPSENIFLNNGLTFVKQKPHKITQNYYSHLYGLIHTYHQ